jgi:hypothetical protein
MRALPEMVEPSPPEPSKNDFRIVEAVGERVGKAEAIYSGDPSSSISR